MTTEAELQGRAVKDVQPRVLCEHCNNVWMNNLEQAAVPLIASLLRGQAIPTDTETLWKLTEWSLAASIVRAEHGGQRTRVPGEVVRAARTGGAAAVSGAGAIFSVQRTGLVGRGVATSAYASAYEEEPGERIVILWIGRIAVAVGLGLWGYRVQRAARVAKRAALALPELARSTPEWAPEATITEEQLVGLLGLDGVSADAFAGRVAASSPRGA